MSDSPTRTGAAIKALTDSIPAEKWPRKLARVAVGVAIIAGGIWLKGEGAPWWVAAIGFGIGCHIWAGEVINKTLATLPKLVAAAIGDVLGAITKGKTP